MAYDQHGGVNPYPDQTALKPLEERLEQIAHPAQIVDPNDPANYFNYSWTTTDETMSYLNWILVGLFAALLVFTLGVMARTRALKFVQFFLTGQAYRNVKLDLAIEAPQTHEQTEENAINQ